MKIYLASGSPRRRELMAQIGLNIEVVVSDADEGCNEKNPAMLVKELSRRKAFAVAEELMKEKAGENKESRESFIVIGADTVVSCDGNVLGKPKDKDGAVLMLKNLSGRTHEVYTGVTICCKKGENLSSNTFYECTKVSFFDMSDGEIEEYVNTNDPLDKAGAYGIQGFCARYISGIQGDYNNVVGLPVGRLYQEIKELLHE
ncbi:MAG: Maf family protein [Lachnospiraceae bacterium]|nr:Maf family protein [Lachnospiraceae bacterium]